jgi:hypothetical protein
VSRYQEKRAGRGLSTPESSTSPLASDQGQYNPPAVSGARPPPAPRPQLEAQWALEPRKFEELPAWDEFLAWGAVARWQDLVDAGGAGSVYARWDLDRAKAVAQSSLRRVWR